MSEQDKKISNIFSNALQSKGWSVDKLSEETGIPERFINLILDERLEELPAAPYAHGYVVKIAETLDLNGEELWQKYFKENESIRSSGAKDKLPENRFEVPGLNKKVLAIAAIFVLIGGYFLIRMVTSSDVSGELTLNNLPEETRTVSSSEIAVSGNIDPRYELTINQAQVYPDKSGNFEEQIELDPGLNTVVFNITGMLGKEGRVVRRVFFEPPNSQNDLNNAPGGINSQNNFQGNNLNN